MNKLLKTSVLALLLSGSVLHSQQSSSEAVKLRAGGAIWYQLNQYITDIKGISGVPSCCPGFTSGSGGGVSFAGFAELPLSPTIGLRTDIGLYNLSGSMEQRETIGNVYTPTGTGIAESRHSLDATLSVVALEPKVILRSFSFPLWLSFGAQVGFVSSKEYAQEERLVTPSGAVYEDTRLPVRNATSGKIGDASSVLFGVAFGAGYDVSVSPDVMLTPEASFVYGINSIVSEGSWNNLGIRFGASVSYLFRGGAEEAPVEIPKKEDPVPVQDYAPPPKVAFELGVDVSGISEGRLLKDPTIVVADIQYDESFPLVSHLYFDKGSSELSSTRQNLLSSPESFSESSLPSSSMSIYREALNIIGYRMKRSASSRIQVTGHVDGRGVEQDNASLARARAESVKEYLVRVWGISAGRIQVEGRGLPTLASNTETADGQAENRRVEITSLSGDVSSPVRQQFTALSVDPDSLQITPTIRADGGVDSWSVEVSNNKGEVLDRVSEPGSAVSPVMLSLGRRYFTPGTEGLRVEVRAADRNGRRLSTEKSVPVRMISETKKAGEDVDDYRIERYSLMLFDFNKSDLTSGHREVLESLRGKLVPGSSVTIEGYTDRSGDATYNRGLADRRCQEVKSYLLGSRTDIPVSVRAVGSDRLLYDNSTPEGRSYSRTVIVEIKTPIKK